MAYSTATMPALVWRGGTDVAVEEVALPERRPGRALLDVAYAGICGTDLHICAGEHPRAKPGLVLWHEIVGRLAEPVTGLLTGTPVFVNPLLSCGACYACRLAMGHVCERLGLTGIDAPGGIARKVSVPATALVPLADDIDFKRAALIEPIAVGMHAVRRSGLTTGQAVHVIGAGPIGLVVAICARHAGAGQVTVTEPARPRASVAAGLGFDVLLPEDAERIAPVVFDCTGYPAVSPRVTGYVATGGTLVTTGVYPGVVGVDLQDLLFREITMTGTRVYTGDDVRAAIDLVTRSDIEVDRLVTGVMPLHHAVEAIELLRSGSQLKVLIEGGGA